MGDYIRVTVLERCCVSLGVVRWNALSLWARAVASEAVACGHARGARVSRQRGPVLGARVFSRDRIATSVWEQPGSKATYELLHSFLI